MEFWNLAISPPWLFKLMIKNCSKIGKTYRKLMSEASTMGKRSTEVKTEA